MEEKKDVMPSPGQPPAATLAQKLDIGALLHQAIEKAVPIDTIERLMALRMTMMQEDARSQYYRALAMFQSKCPVIPKDHTAGSGNFIYRYAPLETIIKKIGPLLELCGLSFTFDTIDTENEKTTICTVHHIAGHSEKSSFKVPIDKTARMNDTQKQGSASTYAKRYSLCNALGILTGEEDDDGAGADVNKAAGQQTSRPTPPPAKKPEPAQEPEKKKNVTVIEGIITNMTKSAVKKNKPTDKDRFRYCIHIGNDRYYTFDLKQAEYAKEYASEGNITIGFVKGQYGNDIEWVYAKGHTQEDFKKFCDKTNKQPEEPVESPI